MTTENGETRDEVEQAAATWIARRDGHGWTPADAIALQVWLDESPGHRVAFYRLNSVWERAGGLEGTRGSSRHGYLAVAATVIVLLAGAVILLQRGLLRPKPEVGPPSVVQVRERPTLEAEPPLDAPPAADAVEPVVTPSFRQRYDTAIGQSRNLSLPDGSRVMLDTDTRIEVTLDEHSRRVQLERGQAFFEVAHDRPHPFVVSAGRLAVTAVGTAFSVRRVRRDVRVAVVEGAVRLEAPGSVGQQLAAGGVALIEGDSLRIREPQPAALEGEISWRSGVLTFRHSTLADAVAEFNRYGTRRIVIRDPGIAALEVGGVFRSNDIEVFVRLLARTYPIDAALYPDRIELTARRSP